MKGVVAYVEVRSSSDNRSAAVCRELQQLGAQIESAFTDDVTHVVFKEGMRRTYNKAVKKGIPLVSVTWLESCKVNQRIMPEKDYAALIPEESKSPLVRLNPHRRWRKMKSMQPYEYEEEVARSAERSVKRRRRVAEANRFKLLEDSTPTSSSPCQVLVPDTQGRSPLWSDLSSSHSPSLATVADTPITPTMKDRIEKMRQEQHAGVSDDQSPKGTGQHKSAILQKRLFEKLAKDIFSTEDSDEEDETTARVVAKLINGLDSQNETDSPRKRAKIIPANEEIQENSISIIKSQSKNSLKTGNQYTSRQSHKAYSRSPKRQIPRISKNNSETNFESEKEVEETNVKALSKSPRVQKRKNSSQESSISKSDVVNNECVYQDLDNNTTNKRKRILLSDSDSVSMFLGPESKCTIQKEPTKERLSKKEEKEKHSQEISFLFGDENKVSTNKRRSARLSVKLSDSSVTDNDANCVKGKRKVHAANVPPSDTVEKVQNCSRAGKSMSMIDDDLSATLKNAHEFSSRRSLDEFSLVSKEKSYNVGKYSRRASNINRKIKRGSGSDNLHSFEEISGDGRKNKSIRDKQQPLLNGPKNSSSEDDTIPPKLRHVNSLLLEISVKPAAKCSHLYLVMTSLHRHEQETVLSIVKKLGVFKLTDNVDEKTTHVVCGEPRRTLNLLRAIAKGCWILKKEWVFESLEAGQWQAEENYEMGCEFPVAKKMRCERMKTGQLFRNELFSNCGPMFVAKNCIPPKKDLINFITMCSGSVTNSHQRATVLIDPAYSKDKKNVKPVWILGCWSPGDSATLFYFRLYHGDGSFEERKILCRTIRNHMQRKQP